MTDWGSPGQSTPARLWTLEISRQSRDGARMVVVSGRISAASSTRLRAALTEELEAGHAQMLVSLDAVDYMSSAGLLILRDVAAQARARGTTFVLTGLSEPVRLAFELAGVRGEFVVEG